jgi:hypothetical protein
MTIIKRRLAAIVVGMAMVAAISVPALAGSGNYEFGNGCNVYWQNSWGGVPLQGSAYTVENEDCALLKVGMYYDPSGGGENWTWTFAGYSYTSYIAVAKYVDQKPGTSRHYGKNDPADASVYITRAF